MLLFQPFWYLLEICQMAAVGTFWIPLLVVVFLFLVPVIFRKRSDTGVKTATTTTLVVFIGLVWLVRGCRGRQWPPVKVLGCPSCHNPMMAKAGFASSPDGRVLQE